MANEISAEETKLRHKIRQIIVREAATPDKDQTGTLMVSQRPDMSIQATVVEVTKAAAYGMERIELLKKRDFPTHKSANAVGMAVDALQTIFEDMLRNPMAYLDDDLEAKVSEYEGSLDAEEAELVKA